MTGLPDIEFIEAAFRQSRRAVFICVPDKMLIVCVLNKQLYAFLHIDIYLYAYLSAIYQARRQFKINSYFCTLWNKRGKNSNLKGKKTTV